MTGWLSMHIVVESTAMGGKDSQRGADGGSGQSRSVLTLIDLHAVV